MNRIPTLLVVAFLAGALFCATAARASSADKPMITHNLDGTFTVQKEPVKRDTKDAKTKKELIIPPQVVVPIIPAPEKKQ